MATLGQTFKEARLKKKLTASEAARGTRIKIQHIDAMEHDDFSSIAAPAYAKGFIRIYAEFLGIDSAPLVQEYMDRHAPADRAPLLQDHASGYAEEMPPRKPFWADWSWPRINWPEIRRSAGVFVARLKIKRPAFRIRPRLLALYALALGSFLTILFGVSRCERADRLHEQEPYLILAPETPTSLNGAPPPDRPLPVLEALPEPYME